MPHQPLSVKIFLCCAVAIFALGGIAILRMAFTELSRVRRRRKHLIRLTGKVTGIEKEQRYRAQSSTSRQQSSYWIEYFPVIVFTTPEGKSSRFRSELGETHQLRRKLTGTEIEPPPPRWVAGQEVEIFYDPAGEIKPCLALAWSLWFTGVGLLVAGSLFLGCSIVMCIFGGPKVPDLSPYKTALELEDGLMDAALQELGPHAASCNTLFLLEPLNRYEQHYLRRVGDAVKAIVRSGETQGVGVLADLFHMNIEETNSPRSLKDGAPWVRHVHLADNTRLEPGSGDLDFAAAF